MPGNTCEAYRLAEKPVRKRGFLHLWWGKLHRAYLTIATKYYMDTLHHHPIPYRPCMVYLPTFTVVFALIPPCSTFFQYLVAKSLNQAGKLRRFGCCPIHCYEWKDSGTCSSERYSWHPPKNQRPKESNMRCSWVLVRILVMLSTSRFKNDIVLFSLRWCTTNAFWRRTSPNR